jgi:hypothetical protein
LPAFLVARTRLVHMRQYLRRTGIDADRLRHLLLFGHPTRTPLDDAMDNSKPNTHDRLPVRRCWRTLVHSCSRSTAYVL